MFAALGAAAFALGCQTAAFHAYNTLEDANLQVIIIIVYFHHNRAK